MKSLMFVSLSIDNDFSPAMRTEIYVFILHFIKNNV